MVLSLPCWEASPAQVSLQHLAMKAQLVIEVVLAPAAQQANGAREQLTDGRHSAPSAPSRRLMTPTMRAQLSLSRASSFRPFRVRL